MSQNVQQSFPELKTTTSNVSFCPNNISKPPNYNHLTVIIN